jgi:hypothetical protein
MLLDEACQPGVLQMLDSLSPFPNATRLTGRRVAHFKRSATERAFLAADLVTGRAQLAKPTIGQAAALLKVSPSYVDAALKAAANGERLKVLQGYQPLIRSKPKLGSLGAHIARSSPAERLKAAREIGVSAIWDSMVTPLL